MQITNNVAVNNAEPDSRVPFIFCVQQGIAPYLRQA